MALGQINIFIKSNSSVPIFYVGQPVINSQFCWTTLLRLRVGEEVSNIVTFLGGYFVQKPLFPDAYREREKLTEL